MAIIHHISILPVPVNIHFQWLPFIPFPVLFKLQIQIFQMSVPNDFFLQLSDHKALHLLSCTITEAHPTHDSFNCPHQTEQVHKPPTSNAYIMLPLTGVK